MYSVFAASDLVGHTALEKGDAPMGVAFGALLPTDGYDRIKEECCKNHRDQSRLQLSITTSAGVKIPAVGVSLLDYSLMLDEPEIQANLIGVDAALYEELFPEHVQAYKLQFT